MDKREKGAKLTPQLLKFSKLVGKAMGDYEMINEGDRILVVVSGSKDSMFLWEMMRYFQRVAPIEFAICPAYINSGIPGFPLAKFKNYFKSCGLGYEHVTGEGQDSFQILKETHRALFDLADQLKFNKIAISQNLDDLAETILENLFYQGEVGSISPKQEFLKGKITVLRPLVYVLAQDIEKIIFDQTIPVVEGNPSLKDMGASSILLRRILNDQEKKNPFIKKNIVNALRNIKTEYLL